MKLFAKLALGLSFALSALCAAPAAMAEDVSLEANIALTTDYRFRGASLSDETIAVQGGFDASFENGFYAGVWGSSIEPVGNSETEIDVYAGFSGEISEGVGFDVGAFVYTYPGSEDTHYVEVHGSVSTAVGDFGVAYAPEQDNLGSEDNLYAYYSGSMEVSDSGISVNFGVGYETGAFGDLDGDGDDKIDWTVGVSKSVGGVDLSLAYIGTSEDTDGSDDTIVFTVSRAF